MKLRKTSSDVSGFLDRGTNMTGELQFAGMVRMDGNFHGSISSEDVLVIGEHAVVHADIKVGDIEIHGQIFGNIEAKRKVEISATGRIRGDIHTSVLSIAPGATLDGQIFMAAGRPDENSPDTTSFSDESNTPQERH